MSEEQAPQANPGSVMYPSSEQPESAEATQEQAQGQEETKEGEANQEQAGEVEGEKQEESKEESSEKEAKDKEEVEYKLELSEGSLLAKEKVDEIAEFAKKHGLSNEAAQEVLKAQEGVISEHMETLREKHQETVEGWYQESMNDPDIGGDKLKQHAERAKRAIEAFGTEGLVNGLKETGYGNHPEVVKVFSKIGELIENDQIVLPGKSIKNRSRAEVLYGNNS